MSVTAGEIRGNRRNTKTVDNETKANEEPSNPKPKRAARGKKAGEVAVRNIDESEEAVNETFVDLQVQSRRGRTKKVEAIDSTIVETKPVARGRGRKNNPVNSTVTVMEVAEEPPAASKRGGRSRRTEPVNTEPDPPVQEVPSSRRTRNTSGASTASNTSERGRSTRTSKAVAEPEPLKESTTVRKGRTSKDSETSTVSTVSNNSVKGKKGKAASANADTDSTVTSSSSTGPRGRKRPAEETPEGSSSKKRMEDVSSTG